MREQRPCFGTARTLGERFGAIVGCWTATAPSTTRFWGQQGQDPNRVVVLTDVRRIAVPERLVIAGPSPERSLTRSGLESRREPV